MSDSSRPSQAKPVVIQKDTGLEITPFFSNVHPEAVTSMVVFPGGGYSGLAAHEGAGYASLLNAWGIHAFVVRYRLGSQGHRHPAMLEDGLRAVRFIRANAESWALDPDKIGVMGSSAGGHLAASVLCMADAGKPDSSDPVEQVSARPNCGVLCYPVISMGPMGHSGSRNNLLGPDPSSELIEETSMELQVHPEVPPCFLFHTVEDPSVPVENSLWFALALRKADVSFEAHLFERGGHGLGIKHASHPWTDSLRAWLERHGWLMLSSGPHAG